MMRLRTRLKLAYGLAVDQISLKRTFESLPDDCMLVSYPRSGSTWLRFLVGNVRYGKEGPTTVQNVNERIPYALRPNNSTLSSLPRPRILKSHSGYDASFRKVVLLIRDPRDVAISYYHYHIRHKKIEPGCPLEEYVNRYVQGQVDGFGPWGEHTGGWLGARLDTEQFLVIQYEKLIADTEKFLRDIVDFIGLDADPESIRRAVSWGSRDNMPSRKACPGEWRDVLPGQSIRLIEDSWSRTMNMLGYESSNRQRKVSSASAA